MRPLYRWSLVLLGLTAAASFMLSVVAGAWWSIGPVEIGPHGTRHCFGGAPQCGLEWVGGSEQFGRIAVGTWGAGLVASFLLVLLAGALAAKRVPRFVARMALASVAMALVMGGLFFANMPTLQGAGIDRGVFLFGIGIGFGAAAAINVLRAKR